MTPLKAILFDLDGTLLPLDQDAFTNTYFKELCNVVCPLGTTPENLVHAIWTGTKAMVKNRGDARNVDVFWETFSQVCPLDVSICRPLCDQFYTKEFHAARIHTRDNPMAAEAIRLARSGNRAVVLATNPIFPLVGQATRLSWIGLTPGDFNLVTSYETECFSKPNPEYYRSICQRLGVKPEECLMIGNDELEDMYAATSIGMSAYLVTDCLLPSTEHPWDGPKGTFLEMLEFLRALS